MMSMKINQRKAGVILSYLTQGIHILSGIIYTPIMLRLLGQSEYGLYQLVFSVVSYLSLLSLGFGASYMRFYSRYKAKEDNNGIAILNGMFMTIFSCIAFLCILCGIAMIAKAEFIFGDGLTADEVAKARILIAIMVFSMAVSFLNSVFSGNITAHEQFFFQRIVEFMRVLFNPFFTLPLLLLGYGSIGMVSVTAFLTVFAFLLNVGYSKKKLKMRFSFRNFRLSLLKEMGAFTFFIFLNMIIDQINWSIDKFLLGRIVGTGAVAIYGVAGQLNTMYMNFSTSVSNVFVPQVNMIVAKENNNNQLTRLFTTVGRVQFIIMALIMSGYILYGRCFISIWAGDGYDASYRIGLFLMLPVTVPLIQNLGIEIQRAKNMHQARSVVYLFIAVSNIFVSIPCIRKWGAEGAAIGTAISLILGNIIFMNLFYHKKIGLDIIYFWKQIFRFIPSMIISIVGGLMIKKIIPLNNILPLCMAIMLYCGLYIISMWLIGMNDYEKSLVGNSIRKIGAILCRK